MRDLRIEFLAKLLFFRSLHSCGCEGKEAIDGVASARQILGDMDTDPSETPVSLKLD
jgi:hypothetical protein